jgi:hypothetical protein
MISCCSCWSQPRQDATKSRSGITARSLRQLLSAIFGRYGIQCYGIGPALDTEDGPKGFGAHSDQERILESELHRFVRFQYDVVVELARTR